MLHPDLLPAGITEPEATVIRVIANAHDTGYLRCAMGGIVNRVGVGSDYWRPVLADLTERGILTATPALAGTGWALVGYPVNRPNR